MTVADLVASEGVADEAAREWPVTVRLRVPVEFGRDRVEELSFRRGQARDMRGIKLSTEVAMDSLMLIASRMSGQPLGVIERLDQDDCGEVFELVLGFFGKCLVTGTRS